jgi:hypothetical protein
MWAGSSMTSVFLLSTVTMLRKMQKEMVQNILALRVTETFLKESIPYFVVK